jgi:hypothetical protein
MVSSSIPLRETLDHTTFAQQDKFTGPEGWMIVVWMGDTTKKTWGCGKVIIKISISSAGARQESLRNNGLNIA